MHIRSATFQTSAPDLASCPSWEFPEFAFIGRSNVGKSSLLNLIAGKRDLAIVSPKPGRTKLINFFQINNHWMLVDLPGYGHAQTNKQERERFQQMIATYLTGRTNLARTYVLIDSRLTPQKIDLEFVRWLSDYGLAFELVFTKADKLKAGPLQENVVLFQEHLTAWGVRIPEVFITSSTERKGRMELLAHIQNALEEI